SRRYDPNGTIPLHLILLFICIFQSNQGVASERSLGAPCAQNPERICNTRGVRAQRKPKIRTRSSR
ncbi:hypothetical protein ACMU9U_004507, partial [Yersinia enterocolitica]